MNALLEKAIEQARKLPDDKQEQLAHLLMYEMAADAKWDQLFADSQDLLSELAAEALEEDRAGETQDLDVDKL